ncbi:MAG TPA: methylmalonyl Co-A mutase-associated GTPase MeaB [Thermoanaerobaculia bacterium]|jgi:LAO/AO transport system kinase|nr:methylmalonyl Co-A mutase-associated GTPase MeaB [Thermoanaerobaculia bacterium]
MIDELAAGVRAGDRTLLGRALTLVESSLPEHQEQARQLLARLAPATGGAQRIGVSGLPGAGKSTLIDRLGSWLVERGHRVAVLAVDPSSVRTGGSILGDKTRMTKLAQDERAFVRPTPSGGSLGGVARRTREAMLVLEAAGHDVVLVETVGVGQSEIAVVGMVDAFLVLLVPGAGDELQGIKRGILEAADLVAINKADEDRPRAERARRDFGAALRMLHAADERWRPAVQLISARTGEGVPELWGALEELRKRARATGELESRRREQRRSWLWDELEAGLRQALREHPAVAAALPALEARVASGEETPEAAAREILAVFHR